MKQRCINVLPTFFSTSGTDVVSTLCNVENPTFVSFSTSDQCYFNVQKTLIQRWNVGWDVLNMYYLVFRHSEQFVKFVDWMGFKGFSIFFRLKLWSSSFFENKFRFDCLLQFLHDNCIAHQDLKPANILVSNKHYGNITVTAELNMWPYKNNPLQYKLITLGNQQKLSPGGVL